MAGVLLVLVDGWEPVHGGGACDSTAFCGHGYPRSTLASAALRDAPTLLVRPGLTFLAWIGEPLSSEPSASTAKEPVPSMS